MTTYPQVLLNVRVRERANLEAIPGVADVMRKVEARLEGDGRLLVRYSGTEPLLRVMLEGQNKAEIEPGAEIVERSRRSSMPSIKLSVNVNKVATLRNSRGGAEPNVVDAVRMCIAADAPGITVHPRADERHITKDRCTSDRGAAEKLAARRTQYRRRPAARPA